MTTLPDPDLAVAGAKAGGTDSAPERRRFFSIRRRARPKRWLRRLSLVALAGPLLWAIGLVWFAGTAARIVPDDGRTTDAIVVLTGGSARLVTGLQLLADQRAPKLFVSGVSEGVDLAELLRLRGWAPNELDCCIMLGYGADDTQGNARETAQWIRGQGLHSLRLVTANYHMPRSLFEFARALPDAEIVPHPVNPDSVHLEDWWRWPGTTELIVSEYNKFLWAHLRSVSELLLTPGRP